MTRVAINGFGRIGRQLLRLGIQKKKNIEFVAINDLSPIEASAHLFKYDSVHRTYLAHIKSTKDSLIIDDKKILMLSQANVETLPWKDLRIDVVLECTGYMTKKILAAEHLKSGAKKVIVSAPCKESDLTVIMGINEHEYDFKKHHVLSNASCTTNCLGMVIKVLNDHLKIKRAFMTTIHSYTNDQRVLDLAHHDLRRARAAGLSIIPTTSGATDALLKIFPNLKGVFEGLSIRVPTPNVSLVDVVCEVEKKSSVSKVNGFFEEACHPSASLKNLLGYCTEPLVSSDFIGDERSAIIDASLTQVVDGNMVKVVAWYDNEVGFSLRMLELVEHIYGSKSH